MSISLSSQDCKQINAILERGAIPVNELVQVVNQELFDNQQEVVSLLFAIRKSSQINVTNILPSQLPRGLDPQQREVLYQIVCEARIRQKTLTFSEMAEQCIARCGFGSLRLLVQQIRMLFIPLSSGEPIDAEEDY